MTPKYAYFLACEKDNWEDWHRLAPDHMKVLLDGALVHLQTRSKQDSPLGYRWALPTLLHNQPPTDFMLSLFYSVGREDAWGPGLDQEPGNFAYHPCFPKKILTFRSVKKHFADLLVQCQIMDTLLSYDHIADPIRLSITNRYYPKGNSIDYLNPTWDTGLDKVIWPVQDMLTYLSGVYGISLDFPDFYQHVADLCDENTTQCFSAQDLWSFSVRVEHNIGFEQYLEDQWQMLVGRARCSPLLYPTGPKTPDRQPGFYWGANQIPGGGFRPSLRYTGETEPFRAGMRLVYVG